MTTHLRNKKGIDLLLLNLNAFVKGEEITVEQYGEAFYEVKIPTGLYSKISAYFTEESYLSGKYGIRLFYRDNHKKEFFIPLEFIDSIFGL